MSVSVDSLDDIAVPPECDQSQAHQGVSQNAHICTSSATVALHFLHLVRFALSGLLIFLFQHPSITFYGFEDSLVNQETFSILLVTYLDK